MKLSISDKQRSREFESHSIVGVYPPAVFSWADVQLCHSIGKANTRNIVIIRYVLLQNSVETDREGGRISIIGIDNRVKTGEYKFELGITIIKV